MNKKLLNEIERIKILISEETLYGRQIDKPSLITEDWRKFLKNVLTNAGKEADEVNNILSDISVILKKTDVDSISSKVKNMDSKKFTTYINGDDFIKDLEKSKEVYKSNDFITKLNSLGFEGEKLDKIIGGLQTKYDENIKTLKSFIDGGGSIPESSTKTIFEPLNLDDDFIKKYNEVFNVKKSKGPFKTVINNMTEFPIDLLKQISEFKGHKGFISKQLNAFFNPFELSILKNWADMFYGGTKGAKGPRNKGGVHALNMFKNPGEDSLMYLYKQIPKAGFKGNFKKGSPLWNAAVKWAKSGALTLGGNYYKKYIGMTVMRYLVETGWCNYIASSSQKSDYVKDHYEPLIDNKIDVLLKEQREKDSVGLDEILYFVDVITSVFAWLTGWPFLSKQWLIDPLGAFGLTKDFSPFSTEWCSNKEKYNEMNKAETALIKYLTKNDISIETEDGTVLTGAEIKNNLDIALKEFRDAANALKGTITTLDYKPLVGELNDIKLKDEYGNYITYERNRDKFMQIIDNYISLGKIPIEKITNSNDE